MIHAFIKYYIFLYVDCCHSNYYKKNLFFFHLQYSKPILKIITFVKVINFLNLTRKVKSGSVKLLLRYRKKRRNRNIIERKGYVRKKN